MPTEVLSLCPHISDQCSGFYYAFAFVVVYTTSRSLDTYYHYDPLKIGLVLLAYGVGMLYLINKQATFADSSLGTVFGSLIGGRWSDYQLSRLKAKNGGCSTPEVRNKFLVYL